MYPHSQETYWVDCREAIPARTEHSGILLMSVSYVATIAVLIASPICAVTLMLLRDYTVISQLQMLFLALLAFLILYFLLRASYAFDRARISPKRLASLELGAHAGPRVYVFRPRGTFVCLLLPMIAWFFDHLFPATTSYMMVLLASAGMYSFLIYHYFFVSTPPKAEVRLMESFPVWGGWYFLFSDIPMIALHAMLLYHVLRGGDPTGSPWLLVYLLALSMLAWLVPLALCSMLSRRSSPRHSDSSR